MGAYDAYKPTFDSRDYLTLIPNFMDAIGVDMAGKASTAHTHGAGGEVVAIGATAARPAVAAGFIYSNTTLGKVEILDAAGAVLSTLASEEFVAVRQHFLFNSVF